MSDKSTSMCLPGIGKRPRGKPKSSGNLYGPIPQQASISGGWFEKEKKGERTILKRIAGKFAVVAGILIGAGWVLSRK